MSRGRMILKYSLVESLLVHLSIRERVPNAYSIVGWAATGLSSAHFYSVPELFFGLKGGSLGIFRPLVIISYFGIHNIAPENTMCYQKLPYLSYKSSSG